MKDVMILSYEGNVNINNAPRGAKRNELIEIARNVLKEAKGEAITMLSNIEYLVGKRRTDYIVSLIDRGIEDNYIEIDYEDYI